MPTYDYRCESTGRVHEVSHPMALSVSNWGELCEVGRFPQGDTPMDSPVTKLLRTGGVVKSAAIKNPEAPPCMTGSGCSGGGVCGF
jgi:hypothetical protein